ncbi:DNA recombination protein RmuC [Actinomycetospora succinea]|uniref:DNA recombination protein RmuC n=1 Tax=Actinomycetospora succinea TaxID=663603 RepID=A0A4R6VCJ5_9PSEU|nr:DNA recombination protein RmuC [Actinomycetospora succinea]TDQ58414.1 DNA recombination protein RmuC [Actinomycetospora succinea]
MTIDGVLAGLLVGLVLGAVIGAWVALRLARAWRDAAVSEAVRRAGAEVAAARAELHAERRGAGDRERALVPAATAASTDALDRVLEPVSTALGRMERQMAGAEREREAAFASLREQVGAVAASAQGVAGETRALVGALRAPHVRGRWGELQLERVVDLAGMVEHCDFTRQAHARGGDDGAQRPDLVVHLAGGKQVVVDAKVPFTAYLESTEARDDTARRERVAAHAKQVRAHVDTLGAKAYWRRFDPTPEFVVMFVPGEVFLSAALEADPTLLEHAFGSDVVIATPTTLMALLRTVAYAWRQEALARNAAEVHALGRELHGRIATLAGHLARLGRSLDGSVRSFNETVSSLESRVLVSARRFTDLSVTTADLESPDQIERRPRSPAHDAAEDA